LKLVIIKHLFFILITFALSYLYYHFTLDKTQGHFVLSGWAFLSGFTSFVIIGCFLLYSNSVKNNTMALLVGLIIKFLGTATFLLIYLSQVKDVKISGVLIFMILYFTFTPWMLYLVMKYYKQNESKKSINEIPAS